ncbi:MAG TPA: ComEA family DNA-binding protein [Acidimicrobiia bacterium]|nr:ComEA family DNA-binding protein [Acidimicrobiia bacterium]
MGEVRGKMPVLVGLAAVALGIGAALGHGGDASVVSSVTTPPPSLAAAPEMMVIHVSGMVMSPGVVDVASGSIVANAIEAAGGLRPGARIDQINLAAPVSAGDQIVVPGPGVEEPPRRGGSGDAPIALNTASAAELETLPGVGPVLAERIVSFRDQNGRFDVVEDLLEVPGIGEAKLAALRDLVRP